jgi:MFS family permease
MFKDKIKNQLQRLYLSNFISNISIAGAAWVLLLVNDGYSLIQVGIAETVFHIVSLSFEIPSGVIADTIGRKKSLLMSSFAALMSAVVRGFLPGFGFVLLSIAFSALSYNFASGSDSALAYDSLLEEKRENEYDRYISNQTVIYRISNGIATLAAGLAVILGNTKAQIISMGLSLINILILSGLKENLVITMKKNVSLSKRFKDTYQGAFRFLKGNTKVAGLIFRNALVGAVDVLLLFFMQAKLPMTGIPEWSLGPLLFFMSLGGILGAKLSSGSGRYSLKKLFFICITIALSGLLTEFTGIWYLMTLGGFLTSFADDLLQIRSDIELNSMVPAEQRATLISVNSFCFSVVMIFMSPLAGWVFSL